MTFPVREGVEVTTNANMPVPPMSMRQNRRVPGNPLSQFPGMVPSSFLLLPIKNAFMQLTFIQGLICASRCTVWADKDRHDIASLLEGIVWQGKSRHVPNHGGLRVALGVG
jgi:hypothetical protein